MIHKLSLQFLKEKEITRKIVEAYWKPAITHKIHVMLPSVTEFEDAQKVTFGWVMARSKPQQEVTYPEVPM